MIYAGEKQIQINHENTCRKLNSIKVFTIYNVQLLENRLKKELIKMFIISKIISVRFLTVFIFKH